MQHAIVLKTPLYHDVYIEKPVEVKIQLHRPSDQTYSDPKQFIYIPDDPGEKLLLNIIYMRSDDERLYAEPFGCML